jgi:hypothetical protein
MSPKVNPPNPQITPHTKQYAISFEGADLSTVNTFGEVAKARSHGTTTSPEMA